MTTMLENTNGRLTQTFELPAPAAKHVQLVGDFTDWDRSPINLQRQQDGVWNGTAELGLGPHHYRFVIDGRPSCLMIRWSAAVVLAAVVWALAAPAQAQDSTATRQKTYRGDVKVVDQTERTVAVEGFWSTKTFNVGDSCRVSVEDRPEATLRDLRPGHRVEVRYADMSGVKVVSELQQKNLRQTGHLSAIDTPHRTFRLEHGRGSKAFVVAAGCKVMVKGDRVGTVDDLKIGHKVTVAYAVVNETNLAQKIEQRDLQFVGTVQAIDAQTRTVKAAHLVFPARKFHLAKDCRIVIDANPAGELSDLRIGQKLRFSYEEADGVWVANRIARDGAPGPASGDQAARQDGALE